MNTILMDFMSEVRDKVEEKYEKIQLEFTNEERSERIFRKGWHQTEEVIAAHIQSIKKQLDRIYDGDLLEKTEIFYDFSMSITVFDQVTGALQIPGSITGENCIKSIHFYRSAVKTYTNNMIDLSNRNMAFSSIPLMLRLAIEVYFKNMIGYRSAYAVALRGKNKGKKVWYSITISKLLDFFSEPNYKKYCKLPIDINILKNINFWSNNFVHTGDVSYAWQNLEAVELLKPLFQTEHENKSMHLEGFNYLSPDFKHDDLIKDLCVFLSDSSREIKIEISSIPVEGKFYYPRNATSKTN